MSAQGQSREEVEREVASVLGAGKCDLRVALAIRVLPKADQPSLAVKLLDSPHAAMRMQAVLILRRFPPKLAAESLRKLLNDEAAGPRNAAALYLAMEAKDPKARELLLKSAVQPDREAGEAVKALGLLGGQDVGPVLKKVLEDNAAPREARLEAVAAAGQVKAAECTAALVALLNDSALRRQSPADPVRVCDMAAGALESIHSINHIGPPGTYYEGPIAKRDEGIALWKEWAKRGGQKAPANTRDAYLSRVLDESLKCLSQSPDGAKRSEVKARLTAAFDATFCLGELPGVDALVAPSVRDAWRIMQAFGDRWWYKVLRPWQDLELAFQRKFLAEGRREPTPDAQALAFLSFAELEWKAEKVWTWALARNFLEVFPNSVLGSKAAQAKERVEADLRKERLRIVVHGHIPVAEPMTGPASRPSNMAMANATALWDAVSQGPSDWVNHEAIIEYCKANPIRVEEYPPFPQQSELYRGSEYPYLGSAAYHLRVQGKGKLALEFADKAVLLNPENPKTFAIRGMIRVAAKLEPEAALSDLRKAYEMDPKSLGDEPETLAAACFLLEKTQAAGDAAAARAMGQVLGELKPYKSDQPLKSLPEFAARLRGD